MYTASTSLASRSFALLNVFAPENFLLRLLQLIVVDVGNCGDSQEFILGEKARHVRAAVADANNAQRQSGVRLRPTNRFRLQDEQTRHRPPLNRITKSRRLLSLFMRIRLHGGRMTMSRRGDPIILRIPHEAVHSGARL